MFRVLIYALAILHLGPGIAFAVLAFGCGEGAALGDICGKSEIKSFMVLTLGLWVIMGLYAYLKLRTRRG